MKITNGAQTQIQIGISILAPYFNALLKISLRPYALRSALCHASNAVNLGKRGHISARFFLMARVILNWTKVLIFVRTAQLVSMAMVELDAVTRQQRRSASADA